MKKKQDQISVKSFVALISAVTAISIFGTLLIISNAGITGAQTLGSVGGTVTTSTQISLPTASITFNNVDVGTTYDTDPGAYSPFVIQNDGNVNLDIDVQMTTVVEPTDLWNTGDSTNTQFKVDVTPADCGTIGATPCFAAPSDTVGDVGITVTSYINMPRDSVPEARVLAIDCLNFVSPKDKAEVDIRINVPSEEPAGPKTGEITFTSADSSPCNAE